MSSQVTTLYTDSAKTNALYPRTKISAISDDDGTALSDVISTLNSNIDEINSNVLSLEEIQASTNLTGKIASASAVKHLVKTVGYIYQDSTKYVTLETMRSYLVITGKPDRTGYYGLYYVIRDVIIPIANNNGNITYNSSTHTLTIPSYQLTFVLELLGG